MDYYATFLQYYKMSNYTKDIWSWSKGPLCKVVQGPSSGHFYDVATEIMLLA